MILNYPSHETIEGGYHVGLEIVPAETKLLSISKSHLARTNLVLQEDPQPTGVLHGQLWRLHLLCNSIMYY